MMGGNHSGIGDTYDYENLENTNLNVMEDSIAQAGREIPQVPQGRPVEKSQKMLDKSQNNADRTRRSERLFRKRVVIKKVSTSDSEVKETLELKERYNKMGGSGSKECGDITKENENLKNRIKLYEAGITDASLHASQTNIGLLNLSSEQNSQCSCPSTSGWMRTMEIVGILMVTLMAAYILYGWCCRYRSYRKEENVRQEAKLMESMKRKMGIEKEEMRLELVGCDKDNGFISWKLAYWSTGVVLIIEKNAVQTIENFL